MKRNKAIMIDEHTIAVVMANGLQILQASVLRGSPYPHMGLLAFGEAAKWRYATEADFDAFYLMWHPEYGV